MKKKFKPWMIAIIPGMVVLLLILVVIFLFILKFVWAWLIPDLFPGAVEQGLVAAEISWFTAFKAAIALAIFGVMCGGKGGPKNECDVKEWKEACKPEKPKAKPRKPKKKA